MRRWVRAGAGPALNHSEWKAQPVAVARLPRSSREQRSFARAEDACIFSHHRGVYLNLVEGLLWVQDVVRSNRTTPTI